MRYALIDKVTEATPGQRLVAVKNVALAEEYLQDHFPAFPVLPGVMMVQALVEAASWLVRISEDFAHALITLAEARNVKYASFLAPGDQMTVEIDAGEIGDGQSKFKASGRCGDRTVVTARLTLRHENLADLRDGGEVIDRTMIRQLRQQWELIRPGGEAGE
jgi:3-hydroxyacyl-[acyl-carrier-protein] dehydratase